MRPSKYIGATFGDVTVGATIQYFAGATFGSNVGDIACDDIAIDHPVRIVYGLCN